MRIENRKHSLWIYATQYLYMFHIGNTRCTFLRWQNGPCKKDKHESRSVSKCINVRLLSWPIFVQCVSKPPRFCFSWWVLVTEAAQGNFSAAQSLAFGARINLGFCQSCATKQVDTTSLHTCTLSNSHVHQLQRKFISIFVLRFVAMCPKKWVPNSCWCCSDVCHQTTWRLVCIKQPWMKTKTNTWIARLFEFCSYSDSWWCKCFRPSPRLDRTQSPQFAVRVQVERPWRIGCSSEGCARCAQQTSFHPNRNVQTRGKKPETSNSSTTQSRSMIISGRNMGATLALAVSLRVPPPSWVQNSNRLNMQIWGWFSDGSLKLFQFWNCSNLKPQKSVCSATKSWNGDAGNRNCGLTAAIFFTDFCRCF